MAGFMSRLPELLYNTGLGELAGDRFLLLRHTGRSTGQTHEAVLQILAHDTETDTYYAAAVPNGQVDWYQNIQRTPAVEVEVQGQKLAGRVEPIDAGEAEAALRTYPVASLEAHGYLADHVDSSLLDDVAQFAARVPMVRVRVTVPAREPEHVPSLLDAIIPPPTLALAFEGGGPSLTGSAAAED